MAEKSQDRPLPLEVGSIAGALSKARLARARDKIKTVDELAAIAERVRAEGGTVAMAHGVFDLIHMGHVRHLEEARHHGSVLMVTVTPDRFVTKGPSRPVFTEMLRAEMLAALQIVDWVAINSGPTAEPALEAIKPNVYVKGPDYANADNDITGKILAERKVVESHGGRVVFTDDLTFSSSSLINQHFDIYSPPVREFLDGMRQAGECNAVLELFDRVKDCRAVVIGDAIIDEYRYVHPMGRAPKENLIATRYEATEIFAGGVIATANNVASLCKEVEVVTVLGEDIEERRFVERCLKPNVRLHALTRRNVATTRKMRFVDSNYLRKLFEVYTIDDSPLEQELESSLNALVGTMAGDFDLVIVNDFGHGMIMPSTITTLVDKARFMAVNAQTNSANFGFNLITKYPHADYLCIDGGEARLAAADRVSSLEEIIEKRLAQSIDCRWIVVTRGKHGCIGYEAGGTFHRVPAFTDKVVDTIGAGDAFLAVTAPLIAAGGAMRHVAFLGNIAGALKVGIVGHRESIDKMSIIKSVVGLLK